MVGPGAVPPHSDDSDALTGNGTQTTLLVAICLLLICHGFALPRAEGKITLLILTYFVVRGVWYRLVRELRAQLVSIPAS